MNYLMPSEYEAYGLETATEESLVGMASALMDAHCRRTTLGRNEYTERLRVRGRNTVRLAYLPVSGGITATRARYGKPGASCFDMAWDVSQAFGLPGSWVELDAPSLDLDARTGEVRLPMGALQLLYDEVEITYVAGEDPLPESVKHACAQIVRNAQSVPALTVKRTALDRVQMDYFGDELLDSSTRVLLAPYVAQKVG
jgi:hypothetical protein